MNVETRIVEYVAALDELREDYFANVIKVRHAPEPVTIEYGRKYARIVAGTSVHTFINMENGDILKAASYKAPAPNGVRGNIFADDLGMNVVGPYGALYLR